MAMAMAMAMALALAMAMAMAMAMANVGNLVNSLPTYQGEHNAPPRRG
jgi:hypothetical protein